MDSGPVLRASDAPLEALTYRDRLADAKYDAEIMLEDGTPEQYRDALAKVDAIKAERAEAMFRVLPPRSLGLFPGETPSQRKAASLARAMETSIERANKAQRHAEYLDWVSACNAGYTKLSLVDWRAARQPPIV